MSGRLEDRHDALAAGSTDRDEAARASSLVVQHLRERGDDPPTRGGKGMASREGGPVDVELAAVERPDRGVEPEAVAAELLALPGSEGRDDRRREGLVDLDEVEVLQ